MFNKFCIQKKQISQSDNNKQKRSKQIYLVYNPTKRVRIESDDYKPFTNLALCPKQVIAFVQNPNFDIENLENTASNLKMPSALKRKETLYKMQKLADKQEEFKNMIIRGQKKNEKYLVKQKRRSQDTMSEVSDKSQLITENSQSISYQTKINPQTQKLEGLDIHQIQETPYNNTVQMGQKNEIKGCSPVEQIISFDPEPIQLIQQDQQDGQFIQQNSPQRAFFPVKSNTFYNIDHEDYFQFKFNNDRIQNDFDNFLYL